MKMLPLTALLLAGCVTTAQNVRIESPLVASLQSETEVREDPQHTARTTRWRSSAGAYPRASLLVESLGERYASSAVFYFDTPENSLHAGMRRTHARGELPMSLVVEEGETVNYYGKAPFLRLSGGGKQCVYSLQYAGNTSRYENSNQLLGHTRIEAWYCDDTVTAEMAKGFVETIR